MLFCIWYTGIPRCSLGVEVEPVAVPHVGLRVVVVVGVVREFSVGVVRGTSDGTYRR